jgi:uncharacterized protein YbbK (DUF523 family)
LLAQRGHAWLLQGPSGLGQYELALALVSAMQRVGGRTGLRDLRTQGWLPAMLSPFVAPGSAAAGAEVLAGLAELAEAGGSAMAGALRDLFALPTMRALPFCPEAHSMGIPRTMPDLHGGDGVDVLEGRARVRDEHGADLTDAMIAGAEAMLSFARAERVELAVLTDMSAACGTQVISDGCRLVPRRGIGADELKDAGARVHRVDSDGCAAPGSGRR